MKRLFLILLMVGIFSVLPYAASFAVTELSSDISATVGTIFSLEFYTEAGKVLYSTAVPFSSVDPANSYNYADGRAEFDGKSDVGLIIRTNQNLVWFLKINMNAASGLVNKLGAFMGQPYTRNVTPGVPTTGTLAYTDWFNLPTTATTVYTAAADEHVNTPHGTLATLSYKIDGAGLSTGSYGATVTYTLTITP